jgi:hypothetical protein
MVGVGASIGMAPPLEASFKNGDLTANIETLPTRPVSIRGRSQVRGGTSGRVSAAARHRFDANAVYALKALDDPFRRQASGSTTIDSTRLPPRDLPTRLA